MNRIKVLIADDILETREVIKKILNIEKESFEVVGEAKDGEEVLKLVPRLKPDIVLMDINMPVLNGLEATEKITSSYPYSAVIIMSVQGENEYLKKAMFYGANEYIIKPFNYNTLVETIKSTYEKHKERLSKQIFHEEIFRDAKIITFFSSKGGVGKSVLSVNSSIIFSLQASKKVLLFDMDLQFGDISMLINEYKQKTIIDAIDDGQIDTYDSIKPYLFNYKDNLDIMFAPRKPEAAEYISKESIEKMFKIFKNQYDYIIVDTGINFSDITLYVLDVSDVILFITTMEIVALKNAKLGLSVMQSLGYDKDKVKLVINRFNTSYGITKKEVEEVFKDNIYTAVPDDEKTVNLSVNSGQPFCCNPKLYKSKLNKGIENMCKNLF